MAKPQPIQQQQPPPPFVNDAGGFWTGIAQENAGAGLSSVLPAGTVNQSDTAIRARQLAAQIRWTPCKARWNGCFLEASISDAQFLLALENGGTEQDGRITLLVSKSQFKTGFPAYEDTMQIQARGRWQDFVIKEIMGQFDDTDPGLTFFLEIDQSDDAE